MYKEAATNLKQLSKEVPTWLYYMHVGITDLYVHCAKGEGMHMRRYLGMASWSKTDVGLEWQQNRKSVQTISLED